MGSHAWRWNGQTEVRIYSVAQHSLLTEPSRASARASTPEPAHRPAARRPRIRDRDMISRSAVMATPTRRSKRGSCRHPPALRVAAGAAGRATALVKAADRSAAYLERPSRHSLDEARRFFGQRRSSAAIERDYLTPWPADLAQARYLERSASCSVPDLPCENSSSYKEASELWRFP
jgi:hypothetical protein